MQRIINASLIVTLLGVAILWAGCGGPKTEPILIAETNVLTTPGTIERAESSQITNINVPDWFVNVPQDPDYIYIARTRSSKDLEMSIDTAQAQARVDLANQVQTKVTAMFKRFREEIGSGEDSELNSIATAVSKDIASESVSGLKVKQQEVVKEGAVYNVFVLFELATGEINSAVLDKVKAQKDMYTRFRASQGFKELEAEVEKYEAWKKEDQAGL